MTTKPDMLLWLSDVRGQYISHDFANSFSDRDKNVSGVDKDDWLILEAGPDHEYYWEAWEDVSNNAVITDENGVKFTVYQNGDCWLIPEGMEWDDREECFKYPEEESEDEV